MSYGKKHDYKIKLDCVATILAALSIITELTEVMSERADTMRKAVDLIETQQATITEQDKVIEQRNIMCSDYFEGHTTSMKRIAELEATITELEAKIQRVAVAANEMYHDNRKGDFELSTLALLDLHGILAALKEEKL